MRRYGSLLVELYEAEWLKLSVPKFVAWAKKRFAEKGGGRGLVYKILREDRDLYEEEQQQQQKAAALEKCSECTPDGWLKSVDGEVIEPTIRCPHDPEAVRVLRAELEAVEEAS